MRSIAPASVVLNARAKIRHYDRGEENLLVADGRDAAEGVPYRLEVTTNYSSSSVRETSHLRLAGQQMVIVTASTPTAVKKYGSV